MSGGTSGGDDDFLDEWEREWDDEWEGDDEAEAAPVDGDGRPLSGPGALAEVWRRAVARLIDVFIMFNLAALFIVLLVDPQVGDESMLTFIAVQAVTLVVVALYEAGLVAWRGATAGKLLLRLRVVRRTDGAPPTPGESTVRCFPWLLLLVPFVGQFLWVVVYLTAIPNRRRQGWHDRAASTLVVIAEAKDRR